MLDTDDGYQIGAYCERLLLAHLTESPDAVYALGADIHSQPPAVLAKMTLHLAEMLTETMVMAADDNKAFVVEMCEQRLATYLDAAAAES